VEVGDALVSAGGLLDLARGSGSPAQLATVTPTVIAAMTSNATVPGCPVRRRGRRPDLTRRTVPDAITVTVLADHERRDRIATDNWSAPHP